MKTLLLFILLQLTSIIACAQDKIQEKNGNLINAKIIDITTEDILYRRLSDANRTTLSIDTKEVLQIIYENGDTLLIASDTALTNSLTTTKNTRLKAKNSVAIISTNVLSPLFERASIAYELFNKNGKASIKFPIVFNYKYAAPYAGVELKIYSAKKTVIRAFVGPSFNIGYKPVSIPTTRNGVAETTVNNYKFIEGLIKAGAFVQVTKSFNIALDGGVGKTNFWDPSITVNKTLFFDVGMHLGFTL
jgi:hypothetical protein